MDETPDWLSQIRGSGETSEPQGEATPTPEEDIPDWLRDIRQPRETEPAPRPPAREDKTVMSPVPDEAADSLASRLRGASPSEEETLVEDADWLQEVRQRDAITTGRATTGSVKADSEDGLRLQSIHVLLLSLLLFLNVSILGCLFLLATQKIVP